MKKWFPRIVYHTRQYFGFSQRETYGTIFLLLLIALALALPYLFACYDFYVQQEWTVVSTSLGDHPGPPA